MFRLPNLVLLCLTAPMLQALEIIAHRGASHDAPENTVVAARLAFTQGADAVEVDVWQTKDGRLAVIHDKTTIRTTGVSGNVKEMTMADLRKLDAGTWKGGSYAGEQVPTLDDILNTRPKGKRIVIEIKDNHELATELAASLKRTGTTARDAVIISFDHPTLRHVKQRLPDYTCLWLASYQPDKKTGKVSPGLDEMIRVCKAAGFDGLNLNFNWPIDRAFTEKVHAAGLRLYVWTVNDADVAKRLVAAGVDGITTDRPAWLREQWK
jgi:glycerophosphoryl diester phosphodiesterase